MKPRFYLYLVVIVILVILAAVLAKSGPSVESQVATACVESGGTFDVSKKTCNMKPAATPAPVVKATAKPAVPSAVPKQEARYYPIHVVSEGSSIYYSSTTTPSMIKVSNPPMNSSISSPATLTGVARGTWYFEATAPVLLTDAKGKILAEGYVTAQNNWMTTEFVPFIGTLAYPAQPSGSNGVLVFRNDNPSGIPSRDQAVEILVKFK